MTWTGSRTGLSPSLTYYERTISPLPCTQMGDKCPHHKHSACQHICIPRLPHCLTQDASTAIMHKVPILNAVLSEVSLPVGDGEPGVQAQGTGVHTLCRSEVRIQDSGGKDRLISQHTDDVDRMGARLTTTILTYSAIWSTCRSIRSRQCGEGSKTMMARKRGHRHG